jgi:hypothetical protein
MGHCGAGANGREKDVADEGQIITKEKDEYGFIELPCPMLEVNQDNENNWKEIVTGVSQRHDIREPRGDPFLKPERRMDPEDEKINLDQP